MKKAIGLAVSAGIILILVAGYFYLRRYDLPGARSGRVLEWLRSPEKHPDWAVKHGERGGQAAFILPTDGYIGYLWGDAFRLGQRHQGLDIFGGTEPGLTPVVAAADGYLTRLPDWKSAVIIRLPQDPLNPSRQIWTYYAHMADPQGSSFISPDFPPGTNEKPVVAGTLLGYQGNYSGDSANPVGVHLHFSIVLDDGRGRFRDELKIQNTLDPSPYFNLPLNGEQNDKEIPLCP